MKTWIAIVSILITSSIFSTHCLAQTGSDAADNARARLRAKGVNVPYQWENSNDKDPAPKDFQLKISSLEINGDQYTFTGSITYTQYGIKNSCTFVDTQLEYKYWNQVCTDKKYFAVLEISKEDSETKLVAKIYKSKTKDILLVDVLSSTISKPRTANEPKMKGILQNKIEGGVY